MNNEKDSKKQPDNRRFNGGARKGAGRPPKAIERKILKRLDPLKTKAYNALKRGLEKDESWAVKMFFDYYYGKPKERKDINVISEQPLFNINYNDNKQLNENNIIDLDDFED